MKKGGIDLGIREQLEEILRLLDTANEDLREWTDSVEQDLNYSRESIKESR